MESGNIFLVSALFYWKYCLQGSSMWWASEWPSYCIEISHAPPIHLLVTIWVVSLLLAIMTNVAMNMHIKITAHFPAFIYLEFRSKNGVEPASFEHPFHLWRVLFWSLASSSRGTTSLSQTAWELGPKWWLRPCYHAMDYKTWIEREQPVSLRLVRSFMGKGTCCRAWWPEWNPWDSG